MKKRLLSCLLVGILLIQSSVAEAAVLPGEARGQEAFAKAQEQELPEKAEELPQEPDEGEYLPVVTKEGEGLFQEGYLRTPERVILESGLQTPDGIMPDHASETAMAEDHWEAWDALVYEQLTLRAERIDVSEFQITAEQVSAWYWGVINEHPDLYFVAGEYSYGGSYGGQTVGYIIPKYREDGREYDNEAFAHATDEALSVLKEGMTDVQKAIALHDHLVLNCEYDYDNLKANTLSDDVYTAYGVLVNRAAVCNGYALAYKYLLQKAGIECYMVSSDSLNHAWNMLKLGGKLYQVDVTWDDPVYDSLGMVRHGNMFVSDSVFRDRQKHTGTDWIIKYRGNELKVTASDTTYDEYFWTGVDSPLVYDGEKYYYVDKDDNSINSIVWGNTAETIYSNLGTWDIAGSGSYYPGAYSGLFLLSDRLYFNSPKEIRSIKLDGSDLRTEFDEADTTVNRIYGLAYCQEEVLYVLQADPVTTEKQTVLKAALSGPVGVDRVLLDTAQLRLRVGTSATLTAQIRPSNAADKTLVWSSSDENIATVSTEGQVTAVAEGNCTITVTGGGKSAECAVTVVPEGASLEKLAPPVFSPVEGSVEKGTKIAITAADGAAIYYTTDGTAPAATGSRYEAKIVVDQDMTIKAYAVKAGYEDSDIATAVYQVKETADTCTVTYDLQGHGAKMEAVTVNAGSKLTAPSQPVAAGWSFGGWYREKTCTNAWDFEKDVVTTDITLYAKWTENKKQEDTANAESPEDVEDNYYQSAERTDLNAVNAKIGTIKPKVYDGNAYMPAVKVTATVDGKTVTLAEGTDYRILYKNNINAGTGKVIIKGNGLYTGAKEADFTIIQKPLGKLKVVVGDMGLNSTEEPPVYVYDGTKLLQNKTDYELLYDKDIASVKGRKDVTVRALSDSNYTGSKKVKVTVYEAEKILKAENVTLSRESVPYTGKAIRDNEPQVKYGTELLVLNQHYKVAYQNNRNAGTAFVIVTGKGEYAGRVVKLFQITPISDSPFEVNPIPGKIYNGKPQKPVVGVKAGGKKLVKNKDYMVAYTNNVHKGTAKVTITGKGNYQGSRATTTFEIGAQKIAKASVKGTREKGLTLTYNKKVLKENTDYRLTYDETSVQNNKIQVTVDGLGDFDGTSVVKKVVNGDAAEAPARVTPKTSTNVGRQNYGVWAETVKSYLVANTDGTFMRVECIGQKVWAETYQENGTCTAQKEIPAELPIFGGFYAGKNAYFLVFGKKNTNEDDKEEVIRVVKYDKAWNKKGACSLYGANTNTPFEAGSLRMTESGDMLYVRTCHKMYKTDDGLNHQANLTFSVRTSDMTITDQFSIIMNIAYGYVSHSFNQFILADGENLVAVDHGDAYPRSAVLIKYPKKAGDEKFLDSESGKNLYEKNRCSYVNVLPISGQTGANATGVSVGGFAASETSYLVVGNSVPQDDASTYSPGAERNIFVTSTKKDAFSEESTTIHWITNYKDKAGKAVSTPQLVEISKKEFLLMWTEKDGRIKSVLLDASGKATTGIYSMEGKLSDCKPVVDGDSVVWYYTSDSAPKFLRIKLADVRKA